MGNTEAAIGDHTPEVASPNPDHGMRIKTLRERYHARWIERHEIWQMYGCPDVRMKAAYALDGSYIGDHDDARHLCETLGIAPERRIPSNNVASVGYSSSKGRWYGWSHRAIADFATRDEAAAFAEEVS